MGSKLRKLALLRPAAVLVALGLVFVKLKDSNPTFWAYYWFTWFFGFYLVPELYWVFNGSQNTLSDNTWRFENLDFAHPFDFAEWTLVHWAFAIVFVLLISWLCLHLLFGLLR